MRLVLVRHGDAHAGFHGMIAGPIGCKGLTDMGRRQAALLHDHLLGPGRLAVDVLMASKLPRAIETARIIAPALGISRVLQDCDLCEMHTGEADGTEWSEYPERFGSFDMAAEPDRAFAPGGESLNTFNARVDRTMNRLARDYPDKTVVAVCHAGIIAASLTALLDMSHTEARLVPTNTALTEWEFEPTSERWTLRYYNNASHLETDAAC